jgi:asparagine synthase (glutamine-hydrolysing)
LSAIYGFIGEGDLSLLHTMGEMLAHRGDECLEWNPESQVFLGQRSFQDFQDSLNIEWMRSVTNGILYNRDEIINLLNLKGVSQTLTDSGLVQAAYSILGLDCFHLFNGDFATGIWDEQEKQLVLARDPLGLRTVYYFVDHGFIAFASEYKALLTLNKLVPDPDLDLIQHFNASKYLPDGKTLIKNVWSVPAGNWVILSHQKSISQRYWSVLVNPRRIEASVAEEDLRKLFLSSLEKRIDSVGQLGAELSGGIDSSAVVGAMRKLRPDRTIKTFTIGSSFDDKEILMARITSAHFDTEHHEVIVDPDELPDDLPGMVWHLEDPVGRTESYLYYRLMRDAGRHVDTIFGGTANDGLFAGMPRHKVIRLLQYLPVFKGPLEEFYHYSQSSYPPRSALGRAIKRVYYGKNEIPTPHIIGAGPLSPPKPLPEGKGGMLNHVLMQGVMYGGPVSLMKAEKTHMAFGVEFRSPFTDIHFVNYAFQLPDHFKIRGFKDKYIIRRALLPFVPEEIVNRRKFPQRMDYDIKLSNVLESMADCYLNPQRVRQRGFFRQEEVEVLRRRRSGQAFGDNQAMRLWTAILTEIWAELFLDRSTRLNLDQ